MCLQPHTALLCSAVRCRERNSLTFAGGSSNISVTFVTLALLSAVSSLAILSTWEVFSVILDSEAQAAMSSTLPPAVLATDASPAHHSCHRHVTSRITS